MKKARMTRRTFTTKDNGGCEFQVEATYNRYYTVVNGECVLVEDNNFSSMGLNEKSLDELKEKVANI